MYPVLCKSDKLYGPIHRFRYADINMLVSILNYNTVIKTGLVNQSRFNVLNRCIGRCGERI